MYYSFWQAKCFEGNSRYGGTPCTVYACHATLLIDELFLSVSLSYPVFLKVKINKTHLCSNTRQYFLQKYRLLFLCLAINTLALIILKNTISFNVTVISSEVSNVQRMATWDNSQTTVWVNVVPDSSFLTLETTAETVSTQDPLTKIKLKSNE